MKKNIFNKLSHHHQYKNFQELLFTSIVEFNLLRLLVFKKHKTHYLKVQNLRFYQNLKACRNFYILAMLEWHIIKDVLENFSFAWFNDFSLCCKNTWVVYDFRICPKLAQMETTFLLLYSVLLICIIHSCGSKP